MPRYVLRTALLWRALHPTPAAAGQLARSDGRAADDAGMPIALVRYGYPRGLDLDNAKAVAVIDDLRELPGLAADIRTP